jgi:hypothetical protein
MLAPFSVTVPTEESGTVHRATVRALALARTAPRQSWTTAKPTGLPMACAGLEGYRALTTSSILMV